MKTDDPWTLDFLAMFALHSYRAQERKRKDRILEQMVREKVLKYTSELKKEKNDERRTV